MQLRTVLLFFLLILPPTAQAFLRGGGASAPPSNWYNSSWLYRKAITIHHAQVTSGGGETYTSFPVLVSETTDSNLSGHAQTTGNDILFTWTDGVTKLNHEIESYTSGTGALVAWVQVDSLSTSADTTIYMYYGNALAPNQQNVAGTWDSNYKGVYHLGTSNTQFVATRYSGNPIINYGGSGTWDYSQVYDPGIMVDPSNSNQLIMYYSGMSAPVETGQECIGRATAQISNPYVWTPYSGNPIICVTNTKNRMDSVIYNPANSTFYLYTTNDTSANYIQLYTSTDGFNFTLYGTVLTPTGQGCTDGTYVSQGAVYFDGTNWTMLYAYRFSGTGGTLPGYRMATSTDGKTWTKSGCTDVISHGSPGAFDSTQMEFHSITKIGSTFVLVYEAFNNVEYWLGEATATSLAGPWTKAGVNPILEATQQAGTFDEFHIATPAFFEVGSTWYLMYCGGAVFSPYGDGRYAFGMATLGGTPLSAMTTGITDSTGNNSLGGTAMPTATGQMDGAFTLDGATGHASSNSSATAVTSGYTLEAWMMPASLSQVGYVAINGLNAGTGGTGFAIGQNNGSGSAGSHLIGAAPSVAYMNSGYAFASTTSWYSTAMVNNGGTTSFMVNGAATSGTSAAVPNAPSGGFAIGQQLGTPSWAGGIDEVRLSSIARSTEWLTTEYNNESAPSSFYTIGAEVPY